MNRETKAKLQDAITLAVNEINRSAVETFCCADKAAFEASIIIRIDQNLTATVEYRVGTFPQYREKKNGR